MLFFANSIYAQTCLDDRVTHTQCGVCTGSIATSLSTAGCKAPYTYTWSNGATNVTSITGLCAGDYQLTFTHSAGTEVYSWTIQEDIFQNYHWAVHPTATEGDETIIDMAVDLEGDVYAIGTYLYQIDFGNTVNSTPVVLNNTVQNTRAVFVAKWDYCGYIEAARTIAWSDIITDSINLHLELLNGSGNVIVAGDFDKQFNITGTTVLNTSGVDIFLGIISKTTLGGLLQAQIASVGGVNNEDRFKGMSVEGGSFAFCGSFRGNTVTIPGYPNNITITNHNDPGATNSDYFHCLYNWNGTLLTLQWATNNSFLGEYRYNEYGMTMQYINPYIYYAYKRQVLVGGYPQSRGYLAMVNSANGALIYTAVIDPGTLQKFYDIQDMTRYNGQLYACGYRHDPANPTNKEAVVLHYTTSIITPANTIVNSGGAGNYNSANKIFVDASGVYVAGTYQNNGFTFGGLSLNLFGLANHFVLKTNHTLAPVYLKCMAYSPSSPSSLGNAISYDANKDVFYLAGTFTNTMNLHASNQGQQITATNSQDAFIARFEDLGNSMEFKNQLHLDGFFRFVSNVSLYPNPTSGTVQVTSTEPITGIVITDISGREFIQIVSTDENESVFVDLSHLQEGTYIVKVSTPGNIKVEKVILTK